MLAMLRRLFRRKHVHHWNGTAWTAHGFEVEQRCECGERRHHASALDYMLDDWTPGAHPIALTMRAHGQTRSAGWEANW